MSKGYGPQSLAVGRIGPTGMLTFAMAAAAPLVVVGGVFVSAYLATGITALPLPIAIVGAILGVFTVGYTRMGSHIKHPGALYAYIAQGLGRPIACGAAWLALAAYHALQVGLYGLLSVTVVQAAQTWFGVKLSWWVPAFVICGVVAILGLRRIDVNRAVTAVLLVVEVGLVLVFATALIVEPADGHLSADVLSPTHLASSQLGALAVIAFLSFIGIEQPSAYSEEARNSAVTVRKAIRLTLLVICVLYMYVAIAMPQGTGPGNLIAAAQEQQTALFFNLAAERLGRWAVHAGLLMQITSILIGLLAFHNVTARYAFSLGREGILPHRLAETSETTGAPKAGSLTQSALAAVTIAVYALAGWDPVLHLFYYVGSSGGYGVLVVLAITGVAVAAYFHKNPHGENLWRRRIAPITAAVLLIGMAILATIHLGTLLGAPESMLRWAIPLFVVVLLVGGLLNGMYIRVYRPDTYARIGLGVRTSVVKGATAARHSSDGHTQEIPAVPAQIAGPIRMPRHVVEGVGGTSEEQRYR